MWSIFSFSCYLNLLIIIINACVCTSSNFYQNIRTRTQYVVSLPGPKPLFSWEENPTVSFPLIKFLSWSMLNPRPLTRRTSKHNSSPSFSLHYVSPTFCLPPSSTSFPGTLSFIWHFVLPSTVSRSSRRDTFP